MSAVFRFAPSPNGRLHLGHAYSALLNADLAARAGGRLLLRIEDIDPVRSRPERVEAILSDLAWLGLTFETPIRHQSRHMPDYRAALDRLVARGLAYPCFCTRGDIRAATVGAFCDPDGAPLYPGTCRGLDAGTAASRATREPHGWRLDMARALRHAPGPHRYSTLRKEPRSADLPPPSAGKGGPRVSEGRERGATGPYASPPSPDLARRLPFPAEGGGNRPCRNAQVQDTEFPATDGADVAADPARWGDAVIARRDVPTSYHLAVVVDDGAQGITHVVRGRDLEAATDLHVLLQALLGLPTPCYHHHALILGPDGEKLAKSKGSETLADLRVGGATAETIRARLGFP
ncbi:glutamate--tRNA ligase family protein [uncultured Methylobacterium sp.]|uniref:glutamate--tRNA ligase family protein n=1 Tax=uncultured Methylobacterium sp. TaxID=157278 RepID=UPI0035CB9B97